MHQSCFDFASDAAFEIGPRRLVVDFGGRNVNGSVADIFKLTTGGRYLALDSAADEGVDVVADASTWVPAERPDTILCFSVLEHASDPEGIVRNAARCLSDDGILVLTAPSDPWPVHSGVDGGSTLHQGETYKNVDPADLTRWLRESFASSAMERHPDGTITVIARKRGLALLPSARPRDAVQSLVRTFRSVGGDATEEDAALVIARARRQNTGGVKVSGPLGTRTQWLRSPLGGEVMQDQKIKLDLACGVNPIEGFEGVDIATGPRIKHGCVNLLAFPWPFEAGSVAEVHCSHFIEHVPMMFYTAPNSLRTDGRYTKAQNDPTWTFEDTLSSVQVSSCSVELLLKFFDECYRILAPGGTAKIMCPQASSDRAFQDPSHRRFIVPATFAYLDKAQRQAWGLEHAAYGISCDFKLADGQIYPGYPDERVKMYPEAVNARMRHERNYAADLTAILKKAALPVVIDTTQAAATTEKAPSQEVAASV